MDKQYDELTKDLARSVTRRGAVKRFGVGLAGLALTTLGLVNKAQAGACGPSGSPCHHDHQCCSGACDHSPSGFGKPQFGRCY